MAAKTKKSNKSKPKPSSKIVALEKSKLSEEVSKSKTSGPFSDVSSGYFEKSQRGIDDSTTALIKKEHAKAMREEKSRKICLCVIIVISVLICIGLVAFLAMNADVFKRPGDHLNHETKATGSRSHQIGSMGKSGDHISPTDAPTKISLSNLTEECMKIAPPGCYYHRAYFPDNCSTTICHSVIVNLKTRVNPLRWHYINETKKINVPEKTPCAQGKYCLGGECVPYNVDEILYTAPSRQGGGVRLNCDAGACLKIDNRVLKDEKRYTTCQGCKKRPWTEGLFADEVTVRFLSCNNPLPVDMEPQCFQDRNRPANKYRHPHADYAPLVLYDFCESCTTNKAMNSCNPILSAAHAYGLPCESGAHQRFKSFCMGDGSCVPLYKHAPKAYALRPIQTCPDESIEPSTVSHAHSESQESPILSTTTRKKPKAPISSTVRKSTKSQTSSKKSDQKSSTRQTIVSTSESRVLESSVPDQAATNGGTDIVVTQKSSTRQISVSTSETRVLESSVPDQAATNSTDSVTQTPESSVPAINDTHSETKTQTNDSVNSPEFKEATNGSDVAWTSIMANPESPTTTVNDEKLQNNSDVSDDAPSSAMNQDFLENQNATVANNSQN